MKQCDYCGNSGQCYHCNDEVRIAMDKRMKEMEISMTESIKKYREETEKRFNAYLLKR